MYSKILRNRPRINYNEDSKRFGSPKQPKATQTLTGHKRRNDVYIENSNGKRIRLTLGTARKTDLEPFEPTELSSTESKSNQSSSKSIESTSKKVKYDDINTITAAELAMVPTDTADEISHHIYVQSKLTKKSNKKSKKSKLSAAAIAKDEVKTGNKLDSLRPDVLKDAKNLDSAALAKKYAAKSKSNKISFKSTKSGDEDDSDISGISLSLSQLSLDGNDDDSEEEDTDISFIQSLPSLVDTNAAEKKPTIAELSVELFGQDVNGNDSTSVNDTVDSIKNINDENSINIELGTLDKLFAQIDKNYMSSIGSSNNKIIDSATNNSKSTNLHNISNETDISDKDINTSDGELDKDNNKCVENNKNKDGEFDNSNESNNISSNVLESSPIFDNISNIDTINAINDIGALSDVPDEVFATKMPVKKGRQNWDNVEIERVYYSVKWRMSNGINKDGGFSHKDWDKAWRKSKLSRNLRSFQRLYWKMCKTDAKTKHPRWHSKFCILDNHMKKQKAVASVSKSMCTFI